MDYNIINDGELKRIYTSALDSLKKLSGEFNDARNCTIPKTWHDFESMGYYDECEALQEVADALDDAELSCNFAINRLQWNVLGEVPEEYDTDRKHYDHDHVDHCTASAPRMASWPEEVRRDWQAEHASASAPDGQRRGLTEEEWRAGRAGQAARVRDDIGSKYAAIVGQLTALKDCAMKAARLGYGDAAYMANNAAERIGEGTELLDEALAAFDAPPGTDHDGRPHAANEEERHAERGAWSEQREAEADVMGRWLLGKNMGLQTEAAELHDLVQGCERLGFYDTSSKLRDAADCIDGAAALLDEASAEFGARTGADEAEEA